ncbi:MAG TPA: hypothetical protein VFT22_21120 [Kofleriaceae bacterium]|nr:hypothetical protein [Kofleriaceae bacterium]
MRSFMVVFLVLAACGDNGSVGHLADAPPSIDAADAAVQMVTLTVTSSGAPVPGVHVYFLNADSSPVATADTDATGSASAVMAAGGSGPALDPFSPQTGTGQRFDELRTFAGVKPGDHLVLTRGATDTVTFTLLASEVVGAGIYDVVTTCGVTAILPGGGTGSGSPSGSVTLDDCHGAADIAIIARDATTGLPISGLFHPGVTLADGGTVDLSNDGYHALNDVTFTILNTPDATVHVLHTPVLAHGRLGPFSLTVSGGIATSPEPTVSASTDIIDTSLTVFGQHHVIDWGAPSATYTLDLANLLLSDLSSLPAFDFATRRLSWGEEKTGASPDLTTAGMTVSRDTAPFRSWHWVIAAPYTPGEIAFPALPTDVADFTPAIGDFVSPDLVTNAKVPGGYDAVRAHILDVQDQIRNPLDLSSFAAGASGRALVVQSPLLLVRGVR